MTDELVLPENVERAVGCLIDRAMGSKLLRLGQRHSRTGPRSHRSRNRVGELDSKSGIDPWQRDELGQVEG